MYLHADNCVGQNKNKILLSYLAWRISNNKNKMIDSAVIHARRTYKVLVRLGFWPITMYISSIQELIECAVQSTPTSKVNFDVSLGNEKGDIEIQVFDWLNFYKDFNARKFLSSLTITILHLMKTTKEKYHAKLTSKETSLFLRFSQLKRVRPGFQKK